MQSQFHQKSDLNTIPTGPEVYQWVLHIKNIGGLKPACAWKNGEQPLGAQLNQVAKITPLGYLCLQLPLDLKPATQSDVGVVSRESHKACTLSNINPGLMIWLLHQPCDKFLLKCYVFFFFDFKLTKGIHPGLTFFFSSEDFDFYSLQLTWQGLWSDIYYYSPMFFSTFV